jgi:hypothetical protein
MLYLVFRLVKSDRSTILVNLCIALILSYTLFLIGVNRTENKVKKKVLSLFLNIWLWNRFITDNFEINLWDNRSGTQEWTIRRHRQHWIYKTQAENKQNIKHNKGKRFLILIGHRHVNHILAVIEELKTKEWTDFYLDVDFKQWRSTIPPISTKRTIFYHLHSLNTKEGNHDIWCWKYRSWLGTGTTMWRCQTDLWDPTPPLLISRSPTAIYI